MCAVCHTVTGGPAVAARRAVSQSTPLVRRPASRVPVRVCLPCRCDGDRKASVLIPGLACLRLSLFVRRLVLGRAGQSESPGLTLGGLGRSCRDGGSTEAPAKAPGAAPCPRTHARRCWGPFPAQEVGTDPFVNSRVDAAGLRGGAAVPEGLLKPRCENKTNDPWPGPEQPHVSNCRRGNEKAQPVTLACRSTVLLRISVSVTSAPPAPSFWGCHGPLCFS